MEDNDNSWVKSEDMGVAKQMLNEAIPSGTIVYPEVEALRYVIAEQKKEILRLEGEVKKAKSDLLYKIILYIKYKYQGSIYGDLVCLPMELEDQFSEHLQDSSIKTIEDSLNAGVYDDWSRQK